MHAPRFVNRSGAALLCTLGAACSAPTTNNPADAGTPDTGTGTTCTALAPRFDETAPAGTLRYVNRDTGDDGNDGTRAHPWKSLGFAGSNRTPGESVHVMAGTYFDCLRVDNAHGTAAAPIRFIADGEVRISCNDGDAVSGSGAEYVTLEGFVVLASGGDGNAIHFDGNSHHLVLRHNEVAGVAAGGDCIKVNQSDDVWVLDNDLHDADTTSGSAQGVDLVAVHRALVRGNHVHDIAQSQAMFAKGGASDVVFERNLIERIAGGSADAIGIVLGGVTDRNAFLPMDADYEGLRLIARNNVVIGADGAGVGAQGCHQCTIANNSLWNTGHEGYAIALSPGATGMNASGNGVSANVDVHVANNLVGNPLGTMRVPIQAEAPQRTGLVLSNNLWWNGDRDDVADPGYNHDVGVDGAGSQVDVDPKVLDDDAPDLHLVQGSPAIHTGVHMDEVAEDYTGMCRPATPSLGAYESGS